MCPDSFNFYLDRKKNFRENQEKIKLSEKQKAGSGNIWKKKTTIPKEFTFLTENNNNHYNNVNNKQISKFDERTHQRKNSKVRNHNNNSRI